MSKEKLTREVEKHLTGKEPEPWEMLDTAPTGRWHVSKRVRLIVNPK
jgi:hypothetical protein